MISITESLNNIRLLDELAEKKSIIHDIHPLVKVLATFIYLVLVISFDKYQIGGLLPFLFYPLIIIALADIPYTILLKRTLIALPFIIGVGIFNPLFDKDILVSYMGIGISGGWISFLSLLIKGLLTIIAVLALIATTGMTRIAGALNMLRVPKIFVMQLLFTYRYIFVLIEEASRMVRGYSLRSPYEKGIRFSHFGPLTGQLLLRTIERAQRIYQAMCCRGFSGEFIISWERKIQTKDLLYLTVWVIYLILARYINITEKIGLFMTGVVK